MTDLDALVIEPLGKRHDRAAFSCGLPELDRYLARQAGQDVRRRIARVFVCTAEASDTVLGFYTLSALAIDLSSLPEELSRKLPRHPVPCALIGRLAVDQSVRRHGLGRMLLVDAMCSWLRLSSLGIELSRVNKVMPGGSGDAHGLGNRGSDSNGAKSHVKGRCWDRLASQDLSPSVSQGTIWRYVAVDRRLGYA